MVEGGLMNFWINKKVLLTGGAGFLGSYIIEKLIERGVKREDIRIPRSRDTDLRRWENCVEVVKDIDIVIHLAARSGGIGFNQKYPAIVFYDNAMMGLQLMEAARLEGVKKFTAIGTVCSYPKYTSMPFKEENLWDGYPEETNASYGIAKRLTLVQAQAYRKQYGFNAIHILLINLYGPRDCFDSERSHVIPALIKRIMEAKLRGKNKIVVWGTGKASRDFFYAEDAAEGILLATEKYNKSEPINLGSGKEIPIRKLVELLVKLLDYRGTIIWDKSKPDGQPRRCLDISKAQKEFGFKPKMEFITGLRKTIDWWTKKCSE